MFSVGDGNLHKHTHAHMHNPSLQCVPWLLHTNWPVLFPFLLVAPYFSRQFSNSDLKRETHIHYIYTRKFTLHCLQCVSCPALCFLLCRWCQCWPGVVCVRLFSSTVLSSWRRGPRGTGLWWKHHCVFCGAPGDRRTPPKTRAALSLVVTAAAGSGRKKRCRGKCWQWSEKGDNQTTTRSLQNVCFTLCEQMCESSSSCESSSKTWLS